MKIPTTLKHKPVIVVDNYDEITAREAEENTKGLSIGLAQWNNRGVVDVSAKVWRHTGEKWSRQSEELPLHRVLDLAVLVVKTKDYISNEAYRHEKLYDPNSTSIARVGVHGDAMNVAVCNDNPMLDEDIRLLRDALEKDGERLDERLHLLANILIEAGYGSQSAMKK